MDIYETVAQIGSSQDNFSSMNAARKFICYYHEFDDDQQATEEHFLLSNREPTDGKTLLSLASERGDRNLVKLFAKYSLSVAIIDESLMKYSDYINETFSKMKTGLTKDEKMQIFTMCFLTEQMKDITSKKLFCDKIIFLLKNRFGKFEHLRNDTSTSHTAVHFAENSQLNYEIIKEILDEKTQDLLKKSFISIYDNIKAVTKDVKVESKNDDDVNNEDESKEQANAMATNEMSFREQFCEYFSRLTESSNIKPGVSTFLTVALLEIGIFWQIATKMARGTHKKVRHI